MYNTVVQNVYNTNEETVVILCYIWYSVAWGGTHDPSDGDDGV